MNQCPICYEENDQIVVVLPCRHEFHCSCLQRWVYHGHNTCPMCRQGIPENTHLNMGEEEDERITTIRQVEMYFQQQTYEDKPLLQRYKDCSIMFQSRFQMEKRIRTRVIAYMLESGLDQEVVETIRRQRDRITCWINYLKNNINEDTPYIMNQTPHVFHIMLLNTHCLERWDTNI